MTTERSIQKGIVVQRKILEGSHLLWGDRLNIRFHDSLDTCQDLLDVSYMGPVDSKQGTSHLFVGFGYSPEKKEHFFNEYLVPASSFHSSRGLDGFLEVSAGAIAIHMVTLGVNPSKFNYYASLRGDQQ